MAQDKGVRARRQGCKQAPALWAQEFQVGEVGDASDLRVVFVHFAPLLFEACLVTALFPIRYTH